MEREIKFKAFDKETKKMHRVGQIDFDHKFCILETEDGAYFERGFSQIELMQFTELTDKNGKEIYEGDLLREPPKNWHDQENYIIFEVFYHSSYGEFRIHRTHYQGNVCGGYIPKFERKSTDKMMVIGNKYQNPEFLK